MRSNRSVHRRNTRRGVTGVGKHAPFAARSSGYNHTWRTAAAGHASESGCAPTQVLPPATASHSEDVSVSPLPIHVSASRAIKGAKEMTFKKVFLKYYDKTIISNRCRLLSANLDSIYTLINFVLVTTPQSRFYH